MTSSKQRRQRAFLENDKEINTGTDNGWFRSVPFIRYDFVTGKILESGAMSVAGLKHLAETENWHYLEVAGNENEHYVKNGRRRHKSSCPATVDGTTLRNLPIPCTIKITMPEGAEPEIHEVNEDTVELDFDFPGEYPVKITSPFHTPGYYQVIHATED